MQRWRVECAYKGINGKLFFKVLEFVGVNSDKALKLAMKTCLEQNSFLSKKHVLLGQPFRVLDVCVNEYSSKAQIKYLDLTKALTYDIKTCEELLESTRDLLLEEKYFLSADEISKIEKIFAALHKREVCETFDEENLKLVQLARALEPCIENHKYNKLITLVVRNLLAAEVDMFRYSGLEIISAGLGISGLADILLSEAQQMLSQEKVHYVKDCLLSLKQSYMTTC